MNTHDKARKIKSLQRELHALQKEVHEIQANCVHQFDTPVYDPIETPHMEYSHLEPHGSDPIPIYVRAGVDRKPRWKRNCLLCGKVEYTEKETTVATRPDFE